MKNKKGFIATTLIYSFFLVFCAIILGFIVMAVHNKNLIAKANDSIRKDLADKKLGNREIGSYVHYDFELENVDTNDIEWIIFGSDSNKTVLVSSGIVFTSKDLAFINQAVNSMSDNCYSEAPRLLNYDDLYVVTEHNVDTIKQLQAILNLDTSGTGTNNTRANYLVMRNGIGYKYTYSEPTSTAELNDLQAYKNKAFAETNLVEYNEGDNINVRIVITLSANTKVIAGDGSYGSPYHISTDKCYGDSYLINKILSKGYDNQNNYTTPGVDATTNDEGLRSDKDDYGVTYYYRGTVENNYVIFANMCWRIVRIDGQGNIRLILQVRGTVNGSPTCNYDSWGVSQLYLNDSYDVLYNSNGMDNTYAGLMYGEEDQTTYDATHAMTHESALLTALKTWYTNRISIANREKLADVIWCNDLAVNPNSSYTGIGKTKTYYNAEYRVYDTINNPPTFKCANSATTTAIGKYSATTTNGGNGKLTIGGIQYKIGTVTADELMFAGAVYDKDTYTIVNTYIKKSDRQSVWTLSPWSYNPTAKGIYITIMNINGRLTNTSATSTGVGVRPMVALKPDVKATGNGTINNPYVIQ